MSDLFDPNPDLDDAALRQSWRDLVERRLPEAVNDHPEWPVRFDHCFARIFLDNAHGRPWKEVTSPPAWRNTDAETLRKALDLGLSVLKGETCLRSLNERSLTLRGKRRKRGTQRV